MQNQSPLAGFPTTLIPDAVSSLSDMMKAEPNALTSPQEDSLDKKLSYDLWKPILSSLISEHDAKIKTKIETNREVRMLDIDIEKYQKSGYLDEDMAFIPIRTVDSNIREEIPTLVRYLVEPNRVAVFKKISDPAGKNSKAETAFTTCIKYNGWLIPIIESFDATSCHGWSAIELCSNDANPGGIEFYHIGDDDFLMPAGTTELQAAPVLGIRYKHSVIQFENLIKNASDRFEAAAVTQIKEKTKDQKKLDKIEYFKLYLKIDGLVYVAYYSEAAASTWLGKPVKFSLGVSKVVVENIPNPLTGEILPQQSRLPVDETKYPIYVRRKNITENKVIQETLGRATLDEPVQEALTSLISAYVNGTNRATQVSASPKGDVEPGTDIEMIDLQFEPGRVWSRPLDYFNPPYPPRDVMIAAQSLDSKNKADIGQLAASVANRNDSRKTAAETKETSTREAELDSVDITLFSAFWTELLNDAWRIIRSKAQENIITFLPNDPDREAILNEVYILLPAGDSDVIAKQEREMQYEKHWPKVVATNIPMLIATYLGDILKDAFPERGDSYAQILLQAVQAQSTNFQQVAQGLLTILEGFGHYPEIANSPAYQHVLPELQKVAGIIHSAAGMQQANQQPNQQAHHNGHANNIQASSGQTAQAGPNQGS